MDRTFTYTKERLRFILEDLLETDLANRAEYRSPERAEEAFEKRATLLFLLWFLEEAFPEGFSFRCRFDDLERDYPAESARRISEGRGWSALKVREQSSQGNVIVVDFRRED